MVDSTGTSYNMGEHKTPEEIAGGDWETYNIYGIADPE
jgi:hypothetical protein